MKIHEFGLWFNKWGLDNFAWSTVIPGKAGFGIHYHGYYLGRQWSDFGLTIYDDEPYIIRLKRFFPVRFDYYLINRTLTLQDFDILENPDCNNDL